MPVIFSAVVRESHEIFKSVKESYTFYFVPVTFVFAKKKKTLESVQNLGVIRHPHSDG